MLVAIIMGKNGLNTLLVASQVVLSFVLPFVAFPLVYITSSPKFMRVRVDTHRRQSNSKDGEAEEFVDFSNSKIVMVLGYLIWLLVLVANGYVLITLAMGKDSCESIRIPSSIFNVLIVGIEDHWIWTLVVFLAGHDGILMCILTCIHHDHHNPITDIVCRGIELEVFSINRIVILLLRQMRYC